jgi:hypothetical protein
MHDPQAEHPTSIFSIVTPSAQYQHKAVDSCWNLSTARAQRIGVACPRPTKSVVGMAALRLAMPPARLMMRRA